MKKLLLTIAAFGAMAVPASADWVGQKVEDPTGSVFTGSYVVSNDDPNTPENEYQEGTQTGYVGVNDDGYVVACNGNPDLQRPDDQSPLQGYIWVGSAGAASNQTAADPTGNIGAGENNKDADGNPTGNSPCPE